MLIAAFHRSKLSSLCLSLLLSLNLICGQTAFAQHSAADFAGNAQFIGLVAAIMEVNRSMQSAAENPMDAWRRQNVRHAIGMLPGAIRGLAGQFKENKFGDSDLPMVQKMLGGFVNPNAAENYKKFLANPDKRLIPKLGSGIPANVLAKVGGGAAAAGGGSDRLVFDDSTAKNGGVDSELTKELASLSDDPSANPVSAPSKPAKSDKLVFDDSAKKEGAPAEGAPTTPNGDSNPISAAGGLNKTDNDTSSFQAPQTQAMPTQAKGGDFWQAANSDLAAVEAMVSPVREPSSSLDKNFFEQKSTKPAAKMTTTSPQGAKADSSQYRSKIQPDFWSPVPFFKLMRLLSIPPAHAEDEGGSEGGGKAANILMGLAMMIAAAAPMVAAAIQADADKKIAKINANAQIAMTQIAANTSKNLADQQAAIAKQQAQIAQQISSDNQKATTDRLTIQLQELDKARTDSNKFEEERLTYQENLDKQRLTVAKQQADESISLANRQERMQEAAAANGGAGPANGGPSRVFNSATGQGLTVQNGPGGFGGGGLASANQSAGATAGNGGFTGSNFASAGGANARGVSDGGTADSSTGLTTNPVAAAGNGIGGGTVRGVTSGQNAASASDQLLSNVGNTQSPDGLPLEWSIDPKTGKRVLAPTSARGVAANAGTAANRLKVSGNSTTTPAALRGIMSSNKAAGSTVQNKFVQASTGSDLGDLLQKTAPAQKGPTVASTPFFRPGANSAVAQSAQLSTHSPGSRGVTSTDMSKVYNAPDVSLPLPGTNNLTHSSSALRGSTGF